MQLCFTSVNPCSPKDVIESTFSFEAAMCNELEVFIVDIFLNLKLKLET